MPMSLETYRDLGLDRQPPLEVNGRGAADFRLSLDHPADGTYQPCPEASEEAGVPAGIVTAHRAWDMSKTYAGARRDLFIYRPPHLDPQARVNLILFNDGAGYLSRKGPVRATQVLDSLQARGEIGPTLAVFVNPGSRRPDSEPDWEQRRREYDPLTAAYGRFVIEELLPFVEGVEGVKITDDPASRMICGISSGGICAFTVAWRNPEKFGCVLSHCGSFVNIDGGHNYPFLVRSTPRKPIRVFLQSGANDGTNVYGDWPLANQTMANALEFAGYDNRFEFGQGGHSLRHGGAIFADSLRWLWR